MTLDSLLRKQYCNFNFHNKSYEFHEIETIAMFSLSFKVFQDHLYNEVLFMLFSNNLATASSKKCISIDKENCWVFKKLYI